ncbi:hypothetical protein GF359_05955 [candidate division WOR-3 bacterium]|uniref:Phosphatidylglycerol--prolipoprotein diacylglyceryl transferase n=1 Tax=candidate division WOR-3 bacterium TaxID=2052148 RepID=A0A9D5K9I9_UNCW3|nr:hypothetical protein [candidate division WOR-3 bacterium]MBD3364742.1 hypothetical protein [candidate division WOR-3 bacterium]
MYRELFKIGNFPVRTYSIFLLLAFVAGMLVVRRLIKRRSLLDSQIVVDLAFWVIIGVIVGARLLFVLMHWPDFADQPLRAFNVMEGGAVYYGGLILGMLFGFLFLLVRWKKTYPGIGFKSFTDKLFTVMDAVAPAMALGEGVGRIGCFFNGCCYGLPTDACGIFCTDGAVHYFRGYGLPTDACGITFPPQSYASAQYGVDHSIWPTQLFQSGGGFLLFGLLILLLFVTRMRKGQLFGIFFFGFGALRFGVNFLRWYDPLTNDLWTNQIIAIGLMVAGVVVFLLGHFFFDKVPTVKSVAAQRRRMEEEARKREEKKKRKSGKRK